MSDKAFEFWVRCAAIVVCLLIGYLNGWYSAKRAYSRPQSNIGWGLPAGIRRPSGMDTGDFAIKKEDIEQIILHGSTNYIVNTVTGADGWRTSTIIPGWTWTNRVSWKHKGENK